MEGTSCEARGRAPCYSDGGWPPAPLLPPHLTSLSQLFSMSVEASVLILWCLESSPYQVIPNSSFKLLPGGGFSSCLQMLCPGTSLLGTFLLL